MSSRKVCAAPVTDDGVGYGYGHVHDISWSVWCWLLCSEEWKVSDVMVGVTDCCGTGRGHHRVNELVALFGACDTLGYYTA